LSEDAITKELGKGTFGVVLKCKDLKHNDHVALKIIRSIERYIDSAKIESDILDDVYDKQNAQGVNLCVKMYSRFRFEGTRICLIAF
jgi:dual-specificity kinase